MSEKDEWEPDDKEQYARFLETAERIQAEDADEKFEEAMKKILATDQGGTERKPDDHGILGVCRLTLHILGTA